MPEILTSLESGQPSIPNDTVGISDDISRHVSESLEIPKRDGVLVIEDEESLNEFVTSEIGLIDASCTVYSAYSLRQAYEFYQQYKDSIGIIFCDMKLPDGKGDEFMQKIHKEGFTYPVIFASGHAREDIEPGLKGIENYIYLMKPYKLADLRKAFRESRSLLSAILQPGK